MGDYTLQNALISAGVGALFIYLLCYHNGVGTIDIFNLKKDSNDED